MYTYDAQFRFVYDEYFKQYFYIIIRLISKSYIRLLKVKRLSNNKNNLLKLDHF